MLGKAWRHPEGALVCDVEIEGVTQKLDLALGYYSGAPHFICESITTKASIAVAKALDLEWDEEKTALLMSERMKWLDEQEKKHGKWWIEEILEPIDEGDK